MTEHGHSHQITYFVNGELQQSDIFELTIGQILENAGFSPASDYSLENLATKEVYQDSTKSIHVHEKEKFLATYKGVTPTSN